MTESITVFLGEKLRGELQEAAERHCRPMAEIVRGALIHYLEGETEPVMITGLGGKSD